MTDNRAEESRRARAPEGAVGDVFASATRKLSREEKIAEWNRQREEERVQRAKTFDRAHRAVRNMHKAVPTLRSFVRAIGRDSSLQFELTEGNVPFTDGKTVYFPVLMKFGDPLGHEPKLCGQRDDEQVLTCTECRRVEDLYLTVFHETAHILHGSFDQADPSVIESEMLAMFEPRGEYQLSKAFERLASLRDRLSAHFGEDRRGRIKTSYLSYGPAFSEYLSLLTNAVEDIRVNEKVIQARPGTAKMFAAHITSVFRDGIEREGTEKRARWADSPLNAQAIIGVYLLALGELGMSLTKYLSPKAQDVLKDAEIRTLASEVAGKANTEECFRLAVAMLIRFKELGFLLDDFDFDTGEESEPEEESESTDDSEGSKESGESEGSGGSKESDGFDEDDDESKGSTVRFGDSQPEDSSSSDEPEPEPESETKSEPESESKDDDSGDDADGEDSGDDADGDDDEDSSDGESKDSTGATGDAGEPRKPRGELEAGGKPDETELAVSIFAGHPEGMKGDGRPSPTKSDETESVEALTDEEETSRDDALRQAKDFDSPSRAIGGIQFVEFDPSTTRKGFESSSLVISLDQAVLQRSVLAARRTFAANKSATLSGGLRRGSMVDARTLGRRIPVKDDRIFAKRQRTSKRSYSVVLGIDISGSTFAYLSSGEGRRIGLMKNAAALQAKLLANLGIPFEVYAHSGTNSTSATAYYDMVIAKIKSFSDPWDTQHQEALGALSPFAANLDGHTLEFYRKRAQSSRATDKIILYYTDGAMPCENEVEELQILKREIKTCQQLGIHLIGVSCENNEPAKYGLETVRLNSVADTGAVLEALRKHLA